MPAAERAEIIARPCCGRVVIFDEPDVRALIREDSSRRSTKGNRLHTRHGCRAR